MAADASMYGMPFRLAPKQLLALLGFASVPLLAYPDIREFEKKIHPDKSAADIRGYLDFFTKRA